MLNQCATLAFYKRVLQQLEFNKRNFNLLELTTEVLGVTDIAFISTLAAACKQAIQAMRDMVANPFDEAVVANLFTCKAEMDTACDHFEETPEESSGDARKVLDIKELNEAVEIIFRCVVACKSMPSQYQEFPRPLVVLDLAVFNIIVNAAKAFNESLNIPDDVHVLTGKTPTTPIVTFVKLPSQKYFTREEREELNRREEEKREAELEARRRAEHMRIEAEQRDSLLYTLCIPKDEREDLVYAVQLADADFSWAVASSGIDFVVRSLAPEPDRRAALLQMGLDIEEGELFCADGEVTPRDLYHAALLIGVMNGGNFSRYKFVLTETCTCCEKDNDRPLPVSTLITYSKTE